MGKMIKCNDLLRARGAVSKGDRELRTRLLEKRKYIFALLLLGMVFMSGLYLWYRSYSFFTYDIRSYDLIESSIDENTGESVLKYYVNYTGKRYDALIENHTENEIRVKYIQSNGEEKTIDILPEESYRYCPRAWSNSVIVRGTGIVSEDLIIQADTIQYLNIFRELVIITLVILMVLTVSLVMVMVIADHHHIKKIPVILTGANLIIATIGIIASVTWDKGWIEGCVIWIAGFLTFMVLVFHMAGCKGEPKKVALSDTEKIAQVCIPTISTAILFLMALYNTREGGLLYYFNSRNRKGVFDYALVTVIFGIMSFILVWYYFERRQQSVKPRLLLTEFLKSREIAICVCSICGIYFVMQEKMGICGTPLRLVFVIIIALILGALLKVEMNACKNSKAYYAIKMSAVTFSFVASGFTAVANTVINYYSVGGSTEKRAYDVDSYYRSIAYVSQGLSITHDNINIYGYYSYFYLPFLRLFGENLETIGVITGIIAGLSMLFFILTIFKMINSNILRLLTVSVATISLNKLLYVAIVPHRILFPCIVLFLMAFYRNRNMKLYHKMLGLFVSVVSIIWNLDSGICVFASWFFFLLVKKCGGSRTVIKDMTITGIKWFAIAGSIIMPFVITGKILLKEDFYKLFGAVFDKEFMTTEQNNFIRFDNSPWVWIYILTMVLFVYGISRIIISVGSEGGFDVGLSVLMMGLMTYFISRPEDYNIIILPLIVASAIVFERLILYFRDEKQKGNDKNSLGVKIYKYLILVVIVMGLSVIISESDDSMRTVMRRMMDDDQLDFIRIKEAASEFEKRIPDGCYIADNNFGGSGNIISGLPEIYMSAGMEIPQMTDPELFPYMISSRKEPEGSWTGVFEMIDEVEFLDMKYYLFENKKLKR